MRVYLFGFGSDDFLGRVVLTPDDRTVAQLAGQLVAWGLAPERSASLTVRNEAGDILGPGSGESEATVAEWRYAASLDDIWAGEMTAVNVGAAEVLLCNLGGTLVAYEDRCPHLASPLSGGALDDSGCDIDRTAAARIRELLDRDLNDGPTRLNLHLATRVWLTLESLRRTE